MEYKKSRRAKTYLQEQNIKEKKRQQNSTLLNDNFQMPFKVPKKKMFNPKSQNPNEHENIFSTNPCKFPSLK